MTAPLLAVSNPQDLLWDLLRNLGKASQGSTASASLSALGCRFLRRASLTEVFRLTLYFSAVKELVQLLDLSIVSFWTEVHLPLRNVNLPTSSPILELA